MSLCNNCNKSALKFACCDKCKKLLCKNCAELQETEWRCVILAKRKMKYFCDDCDDNLDMNESNITEQSIKEDQELVEDGNCICKHLQKENKLLHNTINDKNVIINDKEKIIVVLEEKISDLKVKQNAGVRKPELSDITTEKEDATKDNRSKKSLNNECSPDDLTMKPVGNYAEALQKNKQNSSRDASGELTVDENESDAKTYKKKPKKTTNKVSQKIYGQGQLNDLLVAAPVRNWIWLGGLSESITFENVQEYIKLKFPGRDVSCYDLKSKYRKKCFKVGSSEMQLEDLLDPEVWPAKVILRPFQQSSSGKQHKTTSDNQ